MLAAELSLAEHGAQLLPGLARPLLDALATIASRLPEDRAGTRIAGDPQTAELLGSDGPFGKALASLAAERQRPVRAILFDKNDAANWSLGWHQDRTIAVRRRSDAPGYRRWTIKQGLQHVEPPFAVIARMTTLRFISIPWTKRMPPCALRWARIVWGRSPTIVPKPWQRRIASSLALPKLAMSGPMPRRSSTRRMPLHRAGDGAYCRSTIRQIACPTDWNG